MLSLHRKYRPQTVAQLDQAKARQALGAILSSGKAAQAYLFTGPKGTGKTSSARILSKLLNCETNLSALEAGKPLQEPCNQCDICKQINAGSSSCLTEIDGASNRKIDDIRALREQVALSPMTGKFSVYIIDEVHMLTTEAFNALLKTLEEPPGHVVFCLCTTELPKLPATIVSRCQVIEFGLSSEDELVTALTRAATGEGLTLEPQAAVAIAQASEGSFRDAMNLLQAAMSLGSHIDVDTVAQVAMTRSSQEITQIYEMIMTGQTKAALDLVESMADQGHDPTQITKALLTLSIEQLRAQVVDGASVDAKLMLLVDTLTNAFKRFAQVPLPMLPLLMAIVEFGVKTNSLGQTQSAQASPVTPISATPSTTAKIATTTSKVDKPKQVETPKTPEIVVSEPATAAQEPKPSPELVQDEASDIIKSPSSSSAQVSLDVIQSHWGEVLSQVSQYNHGIVTFLNRSRLDSCRDGQLCLKVAYKFHKEQLEQDRHVRIVEGVLEKVCGGPVRLIVEVESGTSVKQTPHENITAAIPTEDIKLAEVAEAVFS